MKRRSELWRLRVLALLTVVVAGLAAAGCGGSSDSASGGGSASAATTTASNTLTSTVAASIQSSARVQSAAGVFTRDVGRAHRMIEDLMLAANEAVAGYFEDRELPTIFLTQARPRLLPVGGGRAVLDTLLEKRSPAPDLPGCKSTTITNTTQDRMNSPYKV